MPYTLQNAYVYIYIYIHIVYIYTYIHVASTDEIICSAGNMSYTQAYFLTIKPFQVCETIDFYTLTGLLYRPIQHRIILYRLLEIYCSPSDRRRKDRTRYVRAAISCIVIVVKRRAVPEILQQAYDHVILDCCCAANKQTQKRRTR